jgi:hypothetical protein
MCYVIAFRRYMCISSYCIYGVTYSFVSTACVCLVYSCWGMSFVLSCLANIVFKSIWCRDLNEWRIGSWSSSWKFCLVFRLHSCLLQNIIHLLFMNTSFYWTHYNLHSSNTVIKEKPAPGLLLTISITYHHCYILCRWISRTSKYAM